MLITWPTWVYEGLNIGFIYSLRQIYNLLGMPPLF